MAAWHGGRAAGRQGDKIGIKLTRMIDCCQLVRALAHDHREGSARQPRLAVARRASAKSELGCFGIDVVDISQKELKIRHADGLPIGLSIEIYLEHGMVVRGVVRWSEGGFVEIAFPGMTAVDRLSSAAKL